MSDQTGQSGRTGQAAGISRRGLLRAVGAGAAVVGRRRAAEACSSGIKGASSGGTKSITIGWIHPLTGSLAGFGAPDNWVISKIKQTTPYKNGFKIGGKTYPVTIKSYDTQSSPTRAGDLAKTAILSDGVDLLLASSTPETVNAVASQAESLGTPLICSNIPWESWYINLGGNPRSRRSSPSTWSCTSSAPSTWSRPSSRCGTGSTPSCTPTRWSRPPFPNDSDGNAFRAVFPPIAKAAGYTFDMSSAYTDGTTNYSSMISQFKSAKADFFTNVPLPPDFATMWKQAVQQGFKPKLATVAKVLLFPTDAYALGNLVNNVATDAWWAPTLPWKSSFTGETCQQMANEYEASHHGQWNSNISNYSLFEAAHAALTSVSDPHDKAEVADAIHKVNIHGAGRAAELRLRRPGAGRGDHPAGGRAVAEGDQVPAGDAGRRQHAAAAARRSPPTCKPTNA